LLNETNIMKCIFCRFIILLTIFWLTACSTLDKPRLEKQRTFRITYADSAGQMISETWTKEKLEALGIKTISNEYFDRAMHWSESRFSAISFSLLLKRFTLKRGQDAVLLNCFDDYQGILSLDDIYRYDLRLATKITLTPKKFKPDWLHPLLILVPDGKRPPFQERFMTANIRELKFVRLKDYYSPLEKTAGSSSAAQEGIEVFKNNCLFCHSLKGRGGNKGKRLVEAYDFLAKKDRNKFVTDFNKFHHKNNTDKQDLEQFITQEKLERIISYLVVIGRS